MVAAADAKPTADSQRGRGPVEVGLGVERPAQHLRRREAASSAKVAAAQRSHEIGVAQDAETPLHLLGDERAA